MASLPEDTALTAAAVTDSDEDPSNPGWSLGPPSPADAAARPATQPLEAFPAVLTRSPSDPLLSSPRDLTGSKGIATRSPGRSKSVATGTSRDDPGAVGERGSGGGHDASEGASCTAAKVGRRGREDRPGCDGTPATSVAGTASVPSSRTAMGWIEGCLAPGRAEDGLAGSEPGACSRTDGAEPARDSRPIDGRTSRQAPAQQGEGSAPLAARDLGGLWPNALACRTPAAGAPATARPNPGAMPLAVVSSSDVGRPDSPGSAEASSSSAPGRPPLARARSLGVAGHLGPGDAGAADGSRPGWLIQVAEESDAGGGESPWAEAEADELESPSPTGRPGGWGSPNGATRATSPGPLPDAPSRLLDDLPGGGAVEGASAWPDARPGRTQRFSLGSPPAPAVAALGPAAAAPRAPRPAPATTAPAARPAALATRRRHRQTTRLSVSPLLAQVADELRPVDLAASQDDVWGQSERDRIYNAILSVPYQLERLLLIGFLICADSFLSVFTILPLRIAFFLARRLRATARSGALRAAVVRSRGPAPGPVPGVAQAPPGGGPAPAPAGSAPNGVAAGSTGPAVAAPLTLRGDEIYDLVCVGLFGLVLLAAFRLDAGSLYFWLKDLTHEFLKLSVFYAALELADRILCSFSADVLVALAGSCAGLARALERRSGGGVGGTPADPAEGGVESELESERESEREAPWGARDGPPVPPGGRPRDPPPRSPDDAREAASPLSTRQPVDPRWDGLEQPDLRAAVYRALWAVLADALLATCLLTAHVAVVGAQALVFSVALNSRVKTLVGLLVAANFAELKGTVYKRFDGTKLVNLASQDVVERFHLLLQLVFVLSEEAAASGDLAPPPQLALQTLTIFAAEVAIDVIKHAVVGKFNEVRPGVYREAACDVCEAVAGGRRADARRLIAFEPFAAAALFARIAATYASLGVWDGDEGAGGPSVGSGAWSLLAAAPWVTLTVRLLLLWFAALGAKVLVAAALGGAATRILRDPKRYAPGARKPRFGAAAAPVRRRASNATTLRRKDE